MRQQSRIRPFAATVMACVLAGCGGADETDQQAGGPAAAAVEVENPATVRGHIAFTGSPPAPRPIDMRDEPTCAEQHANGVDTADAHDVVVNDGRLQNVFVYISDGVTGSFPTPAEPVLIDQQGCIYHPRIAGVQTGQTITFRNSDGLLHNIKAVPSGRGGFNITQPVNMDTQRSFPQSEVMIPIECNVHGWMHAYVGVLDHPYFAVSGADGSFSIDNLAPGTYTLTTWHERFGTQSQQVTVGPDETADVTFTYDAGMAGRHVPRGAPLDPHAHQVALSPGVATPAPLH
jgi:plastocyanin